ncbi:MAG: tryptophan synthase subunit beta [Desulfovibrionaceae bacterium]|nr:tryptophan synthase subunit beta [Desulfovibrionaceae bacterium]
MSTDSAIPSDSKGFFGQYGGVFVPDELKPALTELADAHDKYRNDPDFLREFHELLANYSGRPTPLFHCRNLSAKLGGAQIYLKREDLGHLGAHKINNTLGQGLLASRMGKKKLIAETGAGQHGVATAAVGALLGMECTVVMGEEDMKRQELNVFRMRMMGAIVQPALSGQRTLKEAVDEALACWAADSKNIFYMLGSAVGPHPYPLMVRDFQSIIGREAREQMLAQTQRLPDMCIACVGGGSNAIGLFHHFVADREVALIGVEPGGKGLGRGEHAATITKGVPGVLHGFRSYVLQDDNGEIQPVHSVSAGLDYPGVGPEHAFLHDSKRASYVVASDQEAMDAFHALSRAEGILPALESSHALAHAMKIAPGMDRNKIILVNLSGRGDKDVEQIARMQNK